jgi:histidinol-phosphate aminotransferase
MYLSDEPKFQYAYTDQKKEIPYIRPNQFLHSPPPGVIKAIEEFIQNSNQGIAQDNNRWRLNDMLTRYTGLPPSAIRISPYRMTAIDSIVSTFAGPGDEILIVSPAPDFMPEICQEHGIGVKYCHGYSPFTSEPSAIMESCNENTKIIYLANPNEISGMVFNNEEIKLLSEYCNRAILIVDEAYYEYYGETSSELVRRCDNLVLVRSLIEGILPVEYRFSYLLSSAANLAEISERQPDAQAPAVAMAAGIAFLENIDYITKQVGLVHENIIYLCSRLRRFGLSCRPTPAEHLLIKVAHPEMVTSFLNSKEIFAYDLSGYAQMEDYVSIIVGADSYSEKIIGVFEEMPDWFYRESPLSKKVVLHRSAEANTGAIL